MNILGTVTAKDAPKSATFCVLHLDCKSIALYYRINEEGYPEYFSSCGSGWVGSNCSTRYEKFLREGQFYVLKGREKELIKSLKQNSLCQTKQNESSTT